MSVTALQFAHISESCMPKERGHPARNVGGSGRDAHAPFKMRLCNFRTALQSGNQSERGNSVRSSPFFTRQVSR